MAKVTYTDAAGEARTIDARPGDPVKETAARDHPGDAGLT